MARWQRDPLHLAARPVVAARDRDDEQRRRRRQQRRVHARDRPDAEASRELEHDARILRERVRLARRVATSPRPEGLIDGDARDVDAIRGHAPRAQADGALLVRDEVRVAGLVHPHAVDVEVGGDDGQPRVAVAARLHARDDLGRKEVRADDELRRRLLDEALEAAQARAVDRGSELVAHVVRARRHVEHVVEPAERVRHAVDERQVRAAVRATHERRRDRQDVHVTHVVARGVGAHRLLESLRRAHVTGADRRGEDERSRHGRQSTRRRDTLRRMRMLLVLALLAPIHARAGEPGAAEVLTLRDGARGVIAWMDDHPALFPSDGAPVTDVPAREQRQAIWDAWRQFLDYVIALDAAGSGRAGWWRLRGQERAAAFEVAHAAHLAKARSALEWIDRVERHDALRRMLDDEVPELGLPAGSYSRLKSDVLGVQDLSAVAAFATLAKAMRCDACAELEAAIAEDAAVVSRFARGRTEELTARNAMHVVRELGGRAWFPVQRRTAQWMGDTKVRRRGVSLIAPEQALALRERLQPGDILITRHEWYVSNVGLPGYWSHAALYVGTPEERRTWAKDDGVRAWVRAQGRADGDFEALVAGEMPATLAASARSAGDGRTARVLEAVSEGVTFSSLEEVAGCDAVAALRPRLTKAEKAAALRRAFSYAGRPYDYHFDFRTDSALVCTELVCKAYEAAGEGRLVFPIATVMGRPVLPANDIARRFDEGAGPRRQLDFVAFLDGDERTRTARERTLTEFRDTWRRPKWHVVAQEIVGR